MITKNIQKTKDPGNAINSPEDIVNDCPEFELSEKQIAALFDKITEYFNYFTNNGG